jgi:hypothetical protein
MEIKWIIQIFRATKSLLFVKTDMTNNSLAKLSKGKRKKTKIYKARFTKGML